MSLVEKLKSMLRRRYFHLTAVLRKKSLNSTNFTIISNNCWGGFVYQSYGIPYNSPTIGLFFMPDDYIKFVANLKEYTSAELTFINPESSAYYNIIKEEKSFGKFPVGKLNDIEIIFLHYRSEKEAYEKWTRRCERINWDKMLVKFNDQNGCTDEHITAFDKLDIKNKICFTAKKYNGLNSVIYIHTKAQDYVRSAQEPIGRSRYVNINKLLNSI